MSESSSSADKKAENQDSSSRSLILHAAGLVGAAMLLSRLVGLFREMVTRSSLGVLTVEATAYEIAKAVPETIFLIIAGGAIGSAFIPTFAAYFTRDDEAGAWHLFSAVINMITVAISLVAILAMIFAPQIVTFFYSENIAAQPQLLNQTVQLMRVMLISPIIFGASGVIMGALNARQHFLLPALAPTVYNLGIIAGALLLGPFFGTAMGLAIGTVIGAAGHLLIQIPGLVQKHARYAPIFTLRDPGVLKVLWLMAPRVLGQSFSELNKLLIVYLTGSMTLGTLPAFTAAFRLIILPQGVLGQAVGIAAFPTLSTLAAENKHDEMRRIISGSLRLLLFLGMPVTILLMMLRIPIITVLFERGLFGAESTELVASALLLMSLGLVALLLLEVIARSFYSLSDTLTPVLAGGVQVILMVILTLWLRDTIFAQRGWLPLGALALGFSLSNYGEVMVLLWLLRRKLGGLDGRVLWNSFWRILLSSLLMAVAMWLLLSRIENATVWVKLMAGGIVGTVVYLLSSWLLRVREAQQLLQYGRQRLKL
ncbi:MAG: murein biosynthesis integral membrane protein MurJ [Candidatus Promineifilaceae bacterium]|nr:murein biosynthesis integral membrane protein MurJ [Candidatus Promineifilaceae bacterium]